MEIASSFEHEQPIPQKHTCDADNVSPPLSISGIPDGAESLAVIVEDPDAPSGTFDHWVTFDIQPTGEIPEAVGELGTAGLNSGGSRGYTGPCPPDGTHRYFFLIHALDTRLGLEEGATKQQVMDAADGHILASGILMGTYSR